ncbi:MAG: glycoside hydrolase family 65 protein, partial [Methanosarcinales archaeon]|nr:glycoside hydrolase family 65 protein [Methanosarcinales archaeon]
EWLIRERGFDPDRQAGCESVFSLGNGYLGSRGVLEEMPAGSSQGMYVAGIFDKSEAETVEIVNLPGPVGFRLYADGEPVAIDQMEVTGHERVLDMKHGTLVRRTSYQSKKSGLHEYRSLRAFSAADEHIMLMRVYFVALGSDMDILVESSIDASTLNIRKEMGTEIKHYSVVEADQTDGICYLDVKLNDSGRMIAYAADLSVQSSDSGGDDVLRTSEFADGKLTESLRFRAHKGIVYTFEKIVSIYTSRDVPPEDTRNIRDVTVDAMKQSLNRGFDEMLAAHNDKWDELWSAADIVIDGDPDAMKALRFNLYHLMIAGSRSDEQVSIAPKALTSSWYNGHFFWDTELFVLPFFAFTYPGIARNLLMYRYYRLDEARKNARKQNLPGALFPWESAETGEEVTPKTWVNPEGTIIDVHTMEREHHITGDIAYAVYQYYRATADTGFMLNYGAEIILETARFWAGRVAYNDTSGKYEIKDVIGPNEYQECVDNNAYTNYLARWNLRCGVLLYAEILRSYPDKRKILCEKIGLKQSEIDEWQKIADNIEFTVLEDDMIEEFSGYFDKLDVTIEKWNERGMPIFPDAVPLERAHESQLVKQADVVLLLHLFNEDFPDDVKTVNLDYYDRRTTHESSLSPSIYAILCTEAGDVDRAYKYLKYALYGDLYDNYGNVKHGIHAASLGGVWQAVVFGFAGVRIKTKGDGSLDEMLTVNPKLPENWKRLRFNLCWQGFKLEFDILTGGVRILFRSASDDGGDGAGVTLPIEVRGRLYEVPGNERTVIRYGD